MGAAILILPADPRSLLLKVGRGFLFSCTANKPLASQRQNIADMLIVCVNQIPLLFRFPHTTLPSRKTRRRALPHSGEEARLY